MFCVTVLTFNRLFENFGKSKKSHYICHERFESRLRTAEGTIF
jgi:hypothetical protein